MPITWKNVNSGSNAAAVRLMEGAGESVNRGFANFDTALRQRSNALENQQNEREQANATDLRDFVGSFKDAESLQQARESGVIDQRRQQYGDDIDREAVRGIGRDRLSDLRTQEVQDFQHQQVQQQQADQPGRDEFVNQLMGINANEGEEGVDRQIGRFQDDVQARVESGELSQRAGAELLQQGRDQANSLRQTARSNRDDKRREQERFVGKEINSIISNTVSGFDEDSDSITAARNGMLERLPDSATPEQRQRAENLLTERLTGRGQLAEADNQRLEERLQQFDAQSGIAQNYFYQQGTTNSPEAVQNLSEKYSVEDDDGIPQLFGIGKSEDRQTMRNAMRDMLTRGYPDGEGGFIPVTEEIMDAALSGVPNSQYFSWTRHKDLEEVVGRTINSPRFRQDREQYKQWERDRSTLEARTTLSLFDGEALPENALTNAPTDRLDQLGQQGAPQYTGGPMMADRVTEDSPGRDARNSVNEFFGELGDLVGADWRNENGLGLTSGLNTNVEDSYINLMMEGAGIMWAPYIEAASFTADFVRDFVSPGQEPSPGVSAVFNIEKALGDNESPSRGDIIEASRFIEENPTAVKQEASNEIARLLGEIN